MILTIGNIKGGVGKTTIAINLAIARSLKGKDILLVDGDEQATASSFTELRTNQIGTLSYTSVRLIGSSLRTQVRKLADKYDDIIIDVGGRDTGSLRAALTVSDILLIPIQPRSFDVWALDQVVELINEAKEINTELSCFSFLNMADPQGKDNEEAAQVIQDYNSVTYIPSHIVRRKAFSNAAANGLSVLEMMPKDVKAIEEIEVIENFIFSKKYMKKTA